MNGCYYDVAQVCKNGHLINSVAKGSPERNQKFCSTCGEETITTCQFCDSEIHGEYQVPGVACFSDFKAPSFCHNCGTPYPWTLRHLEAAEMLADDFDKLTPDDKEKLKLSLPELLKDSPKTVVAENRFKKIMTKAGVEAANAMKNVLIDIVSEGVRKSLFGI